MMDWLRSMLAHILMTPFPSAEIEADAADLLKGRTPHAA